MRLANPESCRGFTKMLSLFLLALFLFAGSALRSQTNEEFRATWVVDSQWLARGKSVDENKALIRQILDNHKATNMTSVLWQVRRFGTTTYPSAIEPWGPQTDFTNPGYDPVAYAIEQAHARGLEFHAWVNVFESRFEYAGSPSQLHPDWVCRDNSGRPMPASIAWLSPGLAAVRAYLNGVAMEIVRNYDIDGLHLDFVRWNEHTNSNSASRMAAEAEASGLPDGVISPAQLRELSTNAAGRFLYDVNHPFSGGVPAGFSTWEDWWRWSVTEFVRALHDSVQAVKPWVRLSPAALGRYNWGGWQGFDVVYQDAALWLNQGYIEQLVGMHYHWTLPSEFESILTDGCPNCWSQFILPSIAAGRLFTVGLFSDRFRERAIFPQHKPILDAVRDIFWVNGFQFFSYASWRDQDYWQTARTELFPAKAKIHANGLIDNTPPAAPALALSQVDSLHYRAQVTPSGSGAENNWFAIYRSQDADLSRDNDEIIDVHFGSGSYAFDDILSGLQDFNGRYHYFATQLDRFWNESSPSAEGVSEPVPSFAPTVARTDPAPGDSISADRPLVVFFSKTIDTTSAAGAISLSPPAQIATLSWSDAGKTLTIAFAGGLQFSTDYTLTISAQLLDSNGRPLDGNGDGLPGDAFSLNFRTEAEDLRGPAVLASFPEPQTDFMLDDVATLVFDEIVAENSLSGAISFEQGSTPVPFGSLLTTVGGRSVLGIQAAQPLAPATDYRISLAGSVSDTLGNQIGGDLPFPFQTAPQSNETLTLIEGFSSVADWFQPDQSGSTTGIVAANTSFQLAAGVYLPNESQGSRSAPALRYEWDEGAASHLIRVFLKSGAPRDVEFDSTLVLQCYVFGDAGGNKFRFAVDDNLPISAASNHEVSAWTTINWLGWRLVEWKLSDPNAVGIWLGNRVLDGRLRFDSLQLTHEPGDATSGILYFDNLRLVKKTTVPVSVAAPGEAVPEQIRLHQNYPNPFNPSTTITFEVPRAAAVTLEVFDVLGRKVKTLLRARKPAGRYRLTFDATGLATGVYMYRLQAGSRVLSKRMLYVK